MLKAKKLQFLLIAMLCLLVTACLLGSGPAAATERQNNYPIVLVHGFSGWGRNEMLGFKYWGGFTDLQEKLVSDGYKTYTAAVGPFSSNWDRACELYAFIKGGRVDYGKAHAAKYGHARYGRTYPGLLPNWGEVDPSTGKTVKIHLIGHSMGGQTIRLLAQLLENGDPDEVATTPPNELSPLFNGQKKSWIHSITTISTPHDGTTLADAVNGMLPFAQQTVALVAAASGLCADDLVYDFKLDQWGLKRQPGETFASYANRVWNSSIWKSTRDISAWDLSPDGARDLNKWVKAQPDIYYFSYGTEATFRELITGHEIPELSMNPIFVPFALHMGAYTRNVPDRVVIDSNWWKNDGVVNTCSMSGPHTGSRDTIVNYNGQAQPGRWHYLGLMESTDHMDIVGIGTLWSPTSWYRNLASLLASLPAN